MWAAGTVAALVLVLGAGGTLSSWTSAVIGNQSDTLATTTAVILREASTGTTCTSSESPSNSSACTTINTYGGTASPLDPGDSRQIDLTFTNLGGSAASSFSLAPGACASSPSTGTPTPTNLCTTAGELSVGMSCSPGASYASASAWMDLTYAAGLPPTVSRAHTAAGGDLGPGASWTCRFTVGLASGASVLDQGVTVTQPLTWTLAQ